MKLFLKILFLLVILVTITFKILIETESEKSIQNQEKTKTSVIGLPLKGEDNGYIGIPKMTAATPGKFDNSFSMLQ